jgi:hypothetical protein
MKPNGKYFVVRALVFALFGIGLLSASGSAETLRGTFKLSTEARWGMMVLAPGDYEFTYDSASSSRVVTVQSRESGWTGMVMAKALSGTGDKATSGLQLATSEKGTYVKSLYISEFGVALDFSPPKRGRELRLTRATHVDVASAAGAQ